MRVLKLLLVMPLAALLLIFAYANREGVTIYFDPIGRSGLAPIEAPAYVVLLVAVALGVIAGSFATWLGQGYYRRAARRAQAEAARLRNELQAARLAPAPSLARQA